MVWLRAIGMRRAQGVCLLWSRIFSSTPNPSVLSARMPASSLPPPTKRQKTRGNETITKYLELQIIAAVADNASLNPLSDLLDMAQNASDARYMSKAIYGLYRAFVVIVSSNKLASGGGDAAKIVRKWIWERLDAYVNLLLGLLQDEEATLRVS